MNKTIQKLRSSLSKIPRPGKGKIPMNIRNLKISNPVKSVSMKLFIIFFCCMVALVAFVGIFSYIKSKMIIEDKVGEATQQTLIQTGDKLEIAFKTFEDLSSQGFTDQAFVKLIEQYGNPGIDSYEKSIVYKDLSTKLMSFVNGKNGIGSAHLLPVRSGKVVSAGNGNSATNFNSEDNKYTKEEWFKRVVQADGGAVWLETRKGGYSGSDSGNMLAISRLMKNMTTGQKDFVLLFEIPLSYVNNYVSKIKLGETGQFYIVNDGDQVVRAENTELVEKKSPVPISVEDKTASLDEPKTLNSSDSGSKQLVVYKKLETTGWTILAAAPISELIKETKEIKTFTYWMVFLAAVIALLAGFLVANMIGKPLRRLRYLMHEGAKGNLTVRTEFARQDEIGQVGVSFDEMMDQITRLVQKTNDSAAEVLRTAEDLLHSSKQTATSAREIAIATEEIASGASSLAVEAERGNSLTNDIGEKMKHVVQANVEMGSAAAEVQDVSVQGTRYMAELSTKTGATEEMTREMVGKVDKLKESTASIRKILEVLDNLTKQTNILSLNATIEAARAGEAGKGFMVVADEIRKLADQSKQSIGVVADITETIRKEVEETVAVLTNAYPLFQEQINSVKEAESIFTQVQSHMNGFVGQLSDVSESVQDLETAQTVLVEAMSNVSAVSEESSATSQEVASLSNEQLNVSEGLVKLSESLEQLSNSLKETLAQFRTE